MTEIFIILISTTLVNNVILDHMLGVSSLPAVSKKLETAADMACIISFTLTLTAMLTYVLNKYVLIPLHIEHLQLLILVLIIPLFILVVMQIMNKIRPDFYQHFMVYIPLTTLNSVVLGMALMNIQQSTGLLLSVFFGLGSGLGYGLVLILFATIHQRIVVTDIPGVFRGPAIILITIGIISMAFMGFTGMVN